MANPLDPVMEWYRTALDSMRVTQRTLNKSLPGAITNRHVFFKQPLTDCTARLQAATEELERLVVLASREGAPSTDGLPGPSLRYLRDERTGIARLRIAPLS